MKLTQNINVAVDAIVFGYLDNELQILLIKQKYGIMQGRWALPGGFVLENESLTDAIHRELLEETGVKVNFLEQLYTFGDDVNRDPRFRVVSIAYFALVNPKGMVLRASTDAIEAKWFTIKEIPNLAYDHANIVEKALQRLRNKLQYEPIGFDLLSKEFLFSELENLYCHLLKREIDRRNFRKKILSLGIVEETDKFSNKKSGRPAKLFKFNKLKYNSLVKNGIFFDI